jgi:HSP20 family protein
MPGLILWKNEEINKLKRDMDRLFSRMWDDFGIHLTPSGMGGIPSLTLSETEDHLVIEAEIPGVDPADLVVSISDDLLTIKGKLREERFEEEGVGQESHGYFSRTFRLPCRIQVDDVDATFGEGVLRIALPKCREEPPREIRIRIR